MANYIPPSLEPTVDVLMDLKAALEKEKGLGPISNDFLVRLAGGKLYEAHASRARRD